MDSNKIIVIGGSKGSLAPILRLLELLPPQPNAAIFIVRHMSADGTSLLPDLIRHKSRWPVNHATDREIIAMGNVYVAPPDYHMLIDKECIRVVQGPKENRFRPAIDPLFRSAAMCYRSNVMGIIVSGALDDGTSGQWLIKHGGGLVMVQDPQEAEVSSMPESVLKEVVVDYCLTLTEMPEVIMAFINRPAAAQSHSDPTEWPTVAGELQIVAGTGPEPTIPKNFGEASRFTCPECGGVLSMVQEGSRLRYRCHTGHGFSNEILMNGINERIEESLWSTIRAAEERIMLLNQTALYFEQLGDQITAGDYHRLVENEATWLMPLRKAVHSLPAIK